MKHLNLLLLLFIGLIALSCTSDDDNVSQTESKFTLNQNEYSTPNGYIIENYGIDDSEQTVILLNGNILNNEIHGEGCDFSNDLKQGIVFNEILSSQNGLQSGVYNFTIPFPSENSIEDVTVITDISMQNHCIINQNSIATSSNQIMSGVLNVEKTNNIYTLNYTIETNNFGTITGTFIGELQVIQDLSS